MPFQARLGKQIVSVSHSLGNSQIIFVRPVDLAHSFGLSCVSIGKALKDLSDKHLIQIGYGQIEILSRAELVALVEKASVEYIYTR